MNPTPRIAAICGSTRKKSSNHALISLIQNWYANKAEIILSESIDSLPHYNPDIDFTQAPPEVESFRSFLNSCEAILISTPEYAMGVPGSLKNAIDWTVSSMEFSEKPTALLTASSVGQKGHHSLLETLLIIQAITSEDTSLVIPYIRSKIDANGTLTDPEVETQIKKVMDMLLEKIEIRRAEILAIHINQER